MNHVTVAFLFNQRFDVQSTKASTQKKCRKLNLKLVRITFQMHYMKVAPRNFGLGTEIVVVGWEFPKRMRDNFEIMSGLLE